MIRERVAALTMNVLLRSASVLALALAALAASADVRYTLVADGGTTNVTIVAPSFITSTSTFVPPQATGIRFGNDTLVSSTINVGNSAFGFSNVFSNGNDNTGLQFPISYLGTPGTYSINYFGSATFTTAVTPEPSALAALGLGATALLRRRKRA